MYNATLEDQCYVQAPNQIGMAWQLTDLIANQANVNIRSMWASEQDQWSQFYMITDDNPRVFEALKDNGYKYFREQQVLVIRGNDQQGDSARIAAMFKDADINIQSMYTTVYDNQPAMIVNTDDNQRAWELFQ